MRECLFKLSLAGNRALFVCISFVLFVRRFTFLSEIFLFMFRRWRSEGGLRKARKRGILGCFWGESVDSHEHFFFSQGSPLSYPPFSFFRLCQAYINTGILCKTFIDSGGTISRDRPWARSSEPLDS